MEVTDTDVVGTCPGRSFVIVRIETAREYEYERSHLPRPRNPDGSVQDW